MGPGFIHAKKGNLVNADTGEKRSGVRAVGLARNFKNKEHKRHKPSRWTRRPLHRSISSVGATASPVDLEGQPTVKPEAWAVTNQRSGEVQASRLDRGLSF
jgi:hypothetical protein